MKNRMYRTNQFPVSWASSHPKPPCPCLQSPAASLAPEKGNYQPPDEKMTSSSSKLHTRSRTVDTRSYCYSSLTHWRQRLGYNCRTARSAPGRSQSWRLPPTKLSWKRSNSHSDLFQVSTSSVAHSL